MSNALRKPRPVANDLFPKSSATVIAYGPRAAHPDRPLLMIMALAIIAAGFMAGLAAKNFPRPEWWPARNYAAPVAVAVRAAPELPAPVAPPVEPAAVPIPQETQAAGSAPLPLVAPAAMTEPILSLSPVASEAPASLPSAPSAPAEAPSPFDITLAAETGRDAPAPPVTVASVETLEETAKKAEAYIVQNDAAHALALYEKARADDADNPAILAGYAYAAQRAGDYDHAVLAERDLLALDPNDAAARAGLVAALGHARNPAALKELQKLATATPAEAAVQAALAEYLLRHGNIKDAETHLLRALQLEPASIAYHLDLAELYDHAGQSEKALSLYRQVLEATTDAPRDRAVGEAEPPALPIDAIRARAQYLALQSGEYH